MICVISYFIIIIILIYLINLTFKALIIMKIKQNFIRQKYNKVNVFNFRDETF